MVINKIIAKFYCARNNLQILNLTYVHHHHYSGECG